MDDLDSTLPDTAPIDLRWAMWWKIAAEAMAEEVLASLPPCHPERRGLTSLLADIRSPGDAALVAAYREWQRHDPMMADAMVHAGRLHAVRIQRRLARWLAVTDEARAEC